MTRQALRTARIMPRLRAENASRIVYDKCVVRAAFGHEAGVGEGIAPTISNAIYAAAIFDDESRFQPPFGGRHAVGDFEIEVLDPDGPRWKGPVFCGKKTDIEIRVGNTEPPRFFGVIRPERHINIVLNNSRRRRERRG